MKKIVLLTALFTALLISCKNKTEKKNGEDSSGNHHANHHHEAEEAKVSLNNGEKWPANPETTQGINNMTAMVNEFPAQPTLDDYHTLKGKLENEFNLVIKQCTMTGEAHNQLHNYLLPLKQEIGKLSSDNTEECKTALENIRHKLEEYNTYFS